MNSDLSARLGALLLSVLLLCGLFSGCNAQPAASSGEAYPVSPPAAALSEAPAKVTEPPGLPSSETPPDAASSPATGAAEPEPPPAEPSPAGQPARPTTLTVRTPAAPGKDKSEGGGAVIDYSNRSEGYVMVKYSAAPRGSRFRSPARTRPPIPMIPAKTGLRHSPSPPETAAIPSTFTPKSTAPNTHWRRARPFRRR